MRLTFACSGPFPPDPEEREPPMLPPYRPTLLHRPFLTPLTGVVKQAVVDTPTKSMRRQTRRQHDETSFQEDETFVYHREIQSEYWSTAGDSWRHHPQYRILLAVAAPTDVRFLTNTHHMSPVPPPWCVSVKATSLWSVFGLWPLTGDSIPRRLPILI